MQQMIQDSHKYEVEDGVVFRKDPKNGRHPVIPRSLVREFITFCHGPVGVGHQGRSKTLALCKLYGWWPQMEKAVKNFVKECPVCLLANRPKPSRAGLFKSPRAEVPFASVQIDYQHLPTSASGYRYLLTFTDEFSGFLIAVPTKTMEEEECAQALANHLFFAYGFPVRLKMDNG